jgi:hypothetical protein
VKSALKGARGGSEPKAVDLSRLALMQKLLASFRRKPESRLFRMYWTPAFAGVTTQADGILFKSLLQPTVKPLGVALAKPGACHCFG